MTKAASNEKAEASKPTEAAKGQRISQTVLPVVSFFQAMRVPKAIWDELAGDGGRPLEVAAAMGMQPAGGNWKSLTGAAIAFGLTEGGYNAAQIKLLPLGRRCVAPEEEGDDAAAMIEAFLKPTLINAFLQKYDAGSSRRNRSVRTSLPAWAIQRSALKPHSHLYWAMLKS